MKLSRLIYLILMMLMLSCSVLYAACSDCTGTKSEGTGISLGATISTTQYGCPGTTVSLSVYASNYDACGDPDPVEDTGLTTTWTGCVTGTGSSKTFTIPSNATPGQSFSTSCTADDDGTCYDDDPSVPVTFTIKALGITGITGITNAALNATVTFTATGEFGNSASSVSWSGGASSGTGSSYITSFGTSGWHAVSATFCGVQKSLPVWVSPNGTNPPGPPPPPNPPGTCPIQ